MKKPTIITMLFFVLASFANAQAFDKDAFQAVWVQATPGLGDVTQYCGLTKAFNKDGGYIGRVISVKAPEGTGTACTIEITVVDRFDPKKKIEHPENGDLDKCSISRSAEYCFWKEGMGKPPIYQLRHETIEGKWGVFIRLLITANGATKRYAWPVSFD